MSMKSHEIVEALKFLGEFECGELQTWEKDIVKDANNCKRVILQTVKSAQELLSNPRVHRNHLIAYMDKNSITYVKSAKKPELIGKIRKHWDSLASKNETLAESSPHMETAPETAHANKGRRQGRAMTRVRSRGEAMTQDKPKGDFIVGDNPQERTVAGDENPQGRTMPRGDLHEGDLVAADLDGPKRTGEMGQASTDFNININLISSTKVLERYYVD